MAIGAFRGRGDGRLRGLLYAFCGVVGSGLVAAGAAQAQAVVVSAAAASTVIRIPATAGFPWTLGSLDVQLQLRVDYSTCHGSGIYTAVTSNFMGVTVTNMRDWINPRQPYAPYLSARRSANTFLNSRPGTVSTPQTLQVSWGGVGNCAAGTWTREYAIAYADDTSGVVEAPSARLSTVAGMCGSASAQVVKVVGTRCGDGVQLGGGAANKAVCGATIFCEDTGALDDADCAYYQPLSDVLTSGLPTASTTNTDGTICPANESWVLLSDTAALGLAGGGSVVPSSGGGGGLAEAEHADLDTLDVDDYLDSMDLPEDAPQTFKDDVEEFLDDIRDYDCPGLFDIFGDIQTFEPIWSRETELWFADMRRIAGTRWLLGVFGVTETIVLLQQLAQQILDYKVQLDQIKGQLQSLCNEKNQIGELVALRTSMNTNGTIVIETINAASPLSEQIAAVRSRRAFQTSLKGEVQDVNESVMTSAEAMVLNQERQFGRYLPGQTSQSDAPTISLSGVVDTDAEATGIGWTAKEDDPAGVYSDIGQFVEDNDDLRDFRTGDEFDVLSKDLDVQGTVLATCLAPVAEPTDEEAADGIGGALAVLKYRAWEGMRRTDLGRFLCGFHFVNRPSPTSICLLGEDVLEVDISSTMTGGGTGTLGHDALCVYGTGAPSWAGMAWTAIKALVLGSAGLMVLGMWGWRA